MFLHEGRKSKSNEVNRNPKGPPVYCDLSITYLGLRGVSVTGRLGSEEPLSPVLVQTPTSFPFYVWVGGLNDPHFKTINRSLP